MPLKKIIQLWECSIPSAMNMYKKKRDDAPILIIFIILGNWVQFGQIRGSLFLLIKIFSNIVKSECYKGSLFATELNENVFYKKEGFLAGVPFRYF